MNHEQFSVPVSPPPDLEDFIYEYMDRGPWTADCVGEHVVWNHPSISLLNKELCDAFFDPSVEFTPEDSRMEETWVNSIKEMVAARCREMAAKGLLAEVPSSVGCPSAEGKTEYRRHDRLDVGFWDNWRIIAV